MIDFNFLKNLDIKTLSRTDLGSSLKFDDVIPSLERIKEYFLFFERNENLLVNTEKDKIRKLFSTFSELVKFIREFNSNSSESHEQTGSRRIQLIKRINTLYDELNEKFYL